MRRSSRQQNDPPIDISNGYIPGSLCFRAASDRKYLSASAEIQEGEEVMMVHRGIRLVFWVILSFLLSSAVCIMLYFLNNKYTDPAPQAENGYLDLTQETEETYSLRFLRDGWAFYPDTLLGPEDFNDGAPKEYMVYTSIGDFTRFDRMGTRETPFGCGTWVLDLWLPETGDYALELPEIFSAYRFYVNDRLVLQTGDPDPETYTPKTQIRTVHLNDSGHVRLILAVSNYTHFYSGIVYPPAFGTLQAVFHYRIMQSLSAASWDIFILILFGLMLGAAFRMHHTNALLFAALCLAAAGYTSYPLIHLFKLSIFPWYWLEIFCGYLLIFLAVTIQNRICMPPRVCICVSQTVSLAFSLLALAYGMLSPVLTVSVMQTFSWFSAAVKLLATAYLLAASFWGIFQRHPESRILLYGNTVYSAFFLWDRLLPVYEPVYGGWFPELGIQILVVFIFCALAADILRAYSFHQSFAESYRQLSRQLAIQKAHYQELTSQIEETVRIRHDQRHHLTVISALLEEGRLSQAQKYLSEYFSDTDLTILFGNLVENAYEACLSSDSAAPSIHLKTAYEHQKFYLRVENTFSNKIHTVNGKYLSGKHDGTGIGTESVRAVVKRLDGQIRFQTLSDHFQVSVILPAEQKIL